MQLAKKIVICAVSAVLAASMLTACGGGGGGSNTPADSKPGNSTEEPANPDDKDPTGGDKDPTDGEDKDPVSEEQKAWEASKTYKANQLLTSTSLKAQEVLTLVDAPKDSELGSAIGQSQSVIAQRSGNMYSLQLGENGTTQRILYRDNKNYEINELDKVAYIYDEELGDNMPLDYYMMVPSVRKPAKPVCGTDEIDGQTYDTETFTFALTGVDDEETAALNVTATYYYDAAETLKYIRTVFPVTNNITATYQVKINAIGTVIDGDVFAVPTKESGYEINDYTDNKTPDPEEPGKDDGEDEEETLPTQWKDSKTKKFFDARGITATDVYATAEFGSVKGAYFVSDSIALMEFIYMDGDDIDNAYGREIVKQGDKYLTGVGKVGTKPTFTESTPEEIAEFELGAKVFKIPAAGDLITGFKCTKTATGYQEDVTVNGVPYRYILDKDGTLTEIVATIDGTVYDVKNIEIYAYSKFAGSSATSVQLMK